MRLDGVEVKVSLAGHETAEAVDALGLADVAPWRIYFVEDVTPLIGASTPLLDAGLVIRARQKSKGKDDVTVKLRPARRSQLTTPWLATTALPDDSELKVEEDWAGERRTLAVALTAERADGVVPGDAGDGGVASLLSKDQQRFLRDCSPVPVNLDVLTVLAPITARRWPTFDVPGPAGSDLSVRAERWTLGHLDFLELSVVADVAVAQAAQRALQAFVVGKGLHEASGATKTSQVLEVLVSNAAETPKHE